MKSPPASNAPHSSLFLGILYLRIKCGLMHTSLQVGGVQSLADLLSYGFYTIAANSRGEGFAEWTIVVFFH